MKSYNTRNLRLIHSTGSNMVRMLLSPPFSPPHPEQLSLPVSLLPHLHLPLHVHQVAHGPLPLHQRHRLPRWVALPPSSSHRRLLLWEVKLLLKQQKTVDVSCGLSKQNRTVFMLYISNHHGHSKCLCRSTADVGKAPLTVFGGRRLCTAAGGSSGAFSSHVSAHRSEHTSTSAWSPQASTISGLLLASELSFCATSAVSVAKPCAWELRSGGVSSVSTDVLMCISTVDRGFIRKGKSCDIYIFFFNHSNKDRPIQKIISDKSPLPRMT